MKTRIFIVQMIMIVLMLTVGVQTGNSVQRQRIVDNVYQLTDQNFDQFTKSGIVLVDFWAVWCGPCRIQGPIIDDLAKDIGQIAIIAKVNVDEAKVTSMRYNIRHIPTIIIFKDGKVAGRYTGVQEKEALMEAINNLK